MQCSPSYHKRQSSPFTVCHCFNPSPHVRRAGVPYCVTPRLFARFFLHFGKQSSQIAQKCKQSDGSSSNSQEVENPICPWLDIYRPPSPHLRSSMQFYSQQQAAHTKTKRRKEGTSHRVFHITFSFFISSIPIS
jgi:hypothetical protein